jgi:hypothetical protein
MEAGDLNPVDGLELEPGLAEWPDGTVPKPAEKALAAQGALGGLGLNWLFVDLNSYFASVEQQDREELRGRPVGVVPMMADTTCCIAASYEAKAHGVKTGTRRGCARILSS